MNFFFKPRQWVSQLLKAYFTILFPQFENHQCYSNAWYNPFDGFRYNALGLRYDSVSKVYQDLYNNRYWFDDHQQIYWNHQNITFDKSGLNYLPDKRRAIDFLGNHYHYWPITHSYQYSGFWSSGLLGNSLVKATAKPLSGSNVSARIFLLKNDPLKLHFFLFIVFHKLSTLELLFPFSLLQMVVSKAYIFLNKNSFTVKGAFTSLAVSSIIIANPMGDFSMINQKAPELEQTLAPTQFSFRNMETFKQTKATKNKPIAKPFSQKQTRVSASTNQITSRFDLDSPVPTISRTPSTDPSRYNTVDLLQDLRFCLEVHTKKFVANKYEQNLKIDPTLETGIQKLDKQLDIATNIAQEKQKWLKRDEAAKGLKGESSVKGLQNAVVNRAFDKNGKPIQKNRKKNITFSRTVAQQLQKYSDLSLSGMKTLVDIQNDPKAALTRKEKQLINQQFAKTPDGQEVEPLGSIQAHIIPDAWSTEPRIDTRAKVLSLKLPFKRFPAPAINNQENFVTTPAFLEKVIDPVTKIEAGVLPKMIETEYNSNWTAEKNYLIANAISHDFYMPALSEGERAFVLQKRKQPMNELETAETPKNETEKTK